MNTRKSTKVYAAFLFMGSPLWKENIEDRVKLLESNVLNSRLKITTADLRKIGRKMREWRFKELSSYSGGAMSLTPLPPPYPLLPSPPPTSPPEKCTSRA